VTDRRSVLIVLARDLPAGAAVPVPREWLLELLGESSSAADPDLRVEELARRFGRSRSTIRTWCELNRFPGAYRFQNREWRVPAGALAIFEATERERAGKPQRSPEGPSGAPPGMVDLSDWRRVG
jgi:hypothetical protein